MIGEGVYLREECEAEVKIIKRPIQDPKCPTLFCCGKPMTAKDAVGVTTEESIKDIVKGRYDACAERGGGEGAVCCPSETLASRSSAAEHGLYSQEELSLVPETAFTLSRGCGKIVSFLIGMEACGTSHHWARV